VVCVWGNGICPVFSTMIALPSSLFDSKGLLLALLGRMDVWHARSCPPADAAGGGAGSGQ
jgi:hypothetical protein